MATSQSIEPTPDVCATCQAVDCKIDHVAQPHRVACECDCGDSPTVGQLGYVLGNDYVSSADALEILKFIVKLPGAVSQCENARKAATITDPAGGVIGTADALEVLKKMVKLPNKIDGTA